MKSAEKIFLSQLGALKPQLVAAAQTIYNQWEQDENGLDVELGAGGPCDEISRAFSAVLAQAGIDSFEDSQDGDDHSFLIAHNNAVAAIVDLPSQLYEHGAGYSWKKLAKVAFHPDQLEIYPTPLNQIFP